MTAVRISRFALARATPEEALLLERSRLIDHVSSEHTGLTATDLIRLQDGRWQDTWTWSSLTELRRATEAAPSFPPEVRTVFAHIHDVEVVDGEVADDKAPSGGLARPDGSSLAPG